MGQAGSGSPRPFSPIAQCESVRHKRATSLRGQSARSCAKPELTALPRDPEFNFANCHHAEKKVSGRNIADPSDDVTVCPASTQFRQDIGIKEIH